MVDPTKLEVEDSTHTLSIKHICISTPFNVPFSTTASIASIHIFKVVIPSPSPISHPLTQAMIYHRSTFSQLVEIRVSRVETL